jgi:LmbE family N-acetylglucosaminyl deacetylase
MSSLDTGESLAVISPHLDDGVFGCGAVLAENPGAAVITVFAGVPASPSTATPWDRSSGFANGAEAMRRRREEDATALAMLDARPWHMDFLDAQYGQPVTATVIARALQGALEALGSKRVVVPMGLFHSDHELTHRAARLLMFGETGRTWWAYEDAMYRKLDGQLEGRLKELRGMGIATEFAGAYAGRRFERKRRAISAYRSQLRSLSHASDDGYTDVFAPERYWALRLDERNVEG